MDDTTGLPADRDLDVAEVARLHGEDAASLLREVSAFRLALDADLTVAAAAVDAQAPVVAREIVDDEVAAVHAFEQGLLERVDRDRRRLRRSRVRVAAPARRPSLNRRAAVAGTGVAIVGLTAAAAVAATDVAHRTSPRPPALTTSVTESAASAGELIAARQSVTLAYAVAHHQPPQAIAAAASALHATIAGMMPAAPNDPALLQQLRTLLVDERTALQGMHSTDPEIVAALAAAQQLLDQLTAQLPVATRTTGPGTPTASTPSPTGTAPSTSSGTPTTSGPAATPTGQPSAPSAPTAPAAPSGTPAPSIGLPSNATASTGLR